MLIIISLRLSWFLSLLFTAINVYKFFSKRLYLFNIFVFSMQYTELKKWKEKILFFLYTNMLLLSDAL